MKWFIEIHTYPSDGDDAKRKHVALGVEDCFSLAAVEATVAATRRELMRLLEEDRNEARRLA